MANKFYKADKATSAEIIRLLTERSEMFDAGRKMAKRIGADPKIVYTNDSFFGTTYVIGFRFVKEPSAKDFVRLKGANDVWRPRARNDIDKEMKTLESCAIAQVHKLIGMQMLGKGLCSQRAGIAVEGKTVYLEVPEDVEPKGCKRITDLAYERATKEQKKVKS